MSKGPERQSEPELTRDQMLDYIRDSGVQIAHIRGYGPGTGQEPDITRLPDESLETIYRMVRFAKEQREELLRQQKEQKPHNP